MTTINLTSKQVLGTFNFYLDGSTSFPAHKELYAHDINGDGIDEIFFAGFETQPNSPENYSNTSIFIYGWKNGVLQDITDAWLPDDLNDVEGVGDISFGDFNNDGLMDALVFDRAWMDENGDWPLVSAVQFLKNKGDGQFEDVTDKVLIGYDHNSNAAYTPVIADFNNDNLLDIFLSSESFDSNPNSNTILLQQKNGTFVDTGRTELSRISDSAAGTMTLGVDGKYHFTWGKFSSNDGINTVYSSELSFSEVQGEQSPLDLAQQMFVVYYGRPADPGGLAYWTNIFDSTGNLDQALDAFGNSEEFTNNFGSLSNNELITNLYQQMYGRNPDADGLAFYADRLESGAATLASIGKQIADGSQNADLDILIYRIVVAHTFSNEIDTLNVVYNGDHISDAQALLAAVGDTQSTLLEGNNSVVAYVSNLEQANVFNGHSYQVVSEAANYTDAKANAEDSGGQLVIIETSEENDFVYNLLINAGVTTTAPDGGGAVYAWIGASDEIAENTWLWLDGSELESSAALWGQGEPDNFVDSSVSPDGQDYAAIALTGWPNGNAGQWNDIAGQNELSYIIEF